ncbi:ABC transporter permease [Brucepastera parasyntrophica]|uniref:ABC transporter permease n=1 Tax=Brucepastera parasyntrophica TaxID=2880008 RepID=UPI002108E753|nr:ABC transporter permease [Brucepastera parasyntrophica]ULQ59058.1 ABC transporter permease [Brucepastera parasyntrophica]
MIKQIGAAVIAKFEGILYTIGFFGKTLKGLGHFIYRGQASYKILTMQILFTFVEALGISSLLALGIGAAVNAIGIPFLASLSQDKLIYPLLIAIITRELGPLLTAFIIIARSATAIATEIAGMVISHEVEAYISVGIDPVEHIGVPRFLGVTISLFLLNIYFSLFGLGGSFLVAQLFSSMSAADYFDNLLQVLTLSDILVTLVKSITFGMIISIIALVRGFSVERASTEVPVAGLKAVGSTFAWCILADILISALYYMV